MSGTRFLGMLVAVGFFAFLAHAADDVFIDEGDGDFDSVPALPVKPATTLPKKAAAKGKKNAAPAKVAQQEASTEVIVTPAEVAAPVVAEEVPTAAAKTETVVATEAPAAPAEAPAVAPAPVAEPVVSVVGASAEPKVETPAPAPKKAASKKTAGAKKDMGIFVTTKEACPMTREPASESAKMITVKASKRIWVQEVDAAYLRAFNKAGEPGYISRDCVQQ